MKRIPQPNNVFQSFHSGTAQSQSNATMSTRSSSSGSPTSNPSGIAASGLSSISSSNRKSPPMVDKTLFRSVPMLAVPSAAMPSPLSFAGTPALKTWSAAIKESDSSATISSTSSPLESFHTKLQTQLKQNNVELPTWTLEEIPSVPIFHRVAPRTLRLVGMSKDTIATRILSFLRMQSITAHLETAKANCTTRDLLKFVICIWKEQNDDQEDATYLIEVQRVQGNSMELQRVKRALERAIHGATTDQPTQSPPAKPAFGEVQAQMQLAEQLIPPIPQPSPVVPAQEVSSDLPKSLQTACDMLDSERLCEHKLGLETLLALTDPRYTFWNQVKAVSHSLLEREDLQRHLQKYLVTKCQPACWNPHAEGSEMASFEASMHVLTLQILGNSLETAVQEGFKVSTKTDFWQQTLLCLEQNLFESQQKVLEASLSIRCLRCWRLLEPNAHPSQAIVDGLVKAYHQGCRSCWDLEQESRSLLEGLGISV